MATYTRRAAIAAMAAMAGTAIFAPSAFASHYADVEDNWAESGGWLGWVEANSLFDADAGNNFRPNDQVTRGEIAVALYRAAHVGKARPIIWNVLCARPDVDGGSELATAVNWCDAHRIEWPDADGTVGDEFGADVGMDHEMLAVALAGYASGARKLQVEGMADAADWDRFSDSDTVSEWARDAVGWCITEQVMTGERFSDGLLHLEPQNPVDRAVAARRVCVAVSGDATNPNER